MNKISVHHWEKKIKQTKQNRAIKILNSNLTCFVKDTNTVNGKYTRFLDISQLVQVAKNKII